MSVQRVTLTSSAEKYAPPAHEIELAVIANDVLITVYDGSAYDLKDGRAKAYQVPPIALNDLLSALGAFGDGVQAFRLVRRQEQA